MWAEKTAFGLCTNKLKVVASVWQRVEGLGKGFRTLEAYRWDRISVVVVAGDSVQVDNTCIYMYFNCTSVHNASVIGVADRSSLITMAKSAAL